MTAGAAAAKTCPKPDEQTGNAHNRKRAHWSKERSTIPKQKTERRPANQAEQEQKSPSLVGRSWNEKSTENTGDTGYCSAQRGGEQTRQADKDSANQRVPERVMIHELSSRRR
jgi:hypothetical protein